MFRCTPKNRIRSVIIITAASALGAMQYTGCAQVQHVAFSTVEGFATESAEDAPLAFEVSGPLAVDVTSFNGTVEVIADASLEGGLVTFTRYATHGYRRTDEAERSLAAISTSAEIVGGDLGQALQVRTSTTHAEPHFQGVRVRIELPEVENVRVHTSNGSVRLTDISGAVDIITDDGDVRVMTRRTMLDPVRIINNSGSIDYRVRGDSAGRIDAEVVRGKVLHHVRLGEFVILRGTDHDTLHAALNQGENPLFFRAADGKIRIAVVKNPTEVGKFIVD